MKQFSRSLCSLIVALEIGFVTGLFDATAATPEVERPLGVLISPFSSEQTTRISSVTIKPPDAGDRVQRPLGVLIDTIGDPITPTPPLLPRHIRYGLSTAPKQQPQSNQPEKASPERPLGVLLRAEKHKSPSARSFLPISWPQAPLPPAVIYKPLSATADRPLGTLIAPQSNFTDLGNIELPKTATTQNSTPETPSSPQGSSEKLPVNLAADQMTVDREKEVVTASGNVEIFHEGRRLFADNISYNQKTGIVTAIGNVTILESTGEQIFGDRMEVTGDLKDGVIENIGVILQDHSRIAGTGARLTASRLTELRKATYSPCKLCEDNPARPPLWQLKAVRVIHDKNQKIVEYRDAWLEMFGLPVFYTPYFRHPDPTVKRQSGFLFPTYGSSSDFGIVLETPYFWNISPHQDATITPILMSNEFPVLTLEYRNRLRKGFINFDASITENSDDEFNTTDGDMGVRGHLDTEVRFDINRTWRWGFDLERTTDNTYMRRYGFTSPQSLNSKFFAEAFRSQSYFSASTHAFQGLEESDTADETPIVFPLLDFNHVGKRDTIGGRSFLDVNFLALTRAEGTDTRRMSFHPRWKRPSITDFGDSINLTLGLNADFYQVNGLDRVNKTGSYNGFAYRTVPYAAIDWSRPLVKRTGNASQTIEPVTSLVLRPYGGNSEKIPNEDSAELEFDETNLFSDNRFTGIDRLEGGPRINYGLQWALTGDNGSRSSVFFGQSYRVKDDSTFGEGSGLEDNFSDLVGKAQFSLNSYLELLYRTRLAVDNLSANRNEAQFSAGVPAFSITGSYIFLDRQEEGEFAGREELNIISSTQLTREWKSTLRATRDIDSSEMRAAGMEVIYENECVVFRTSFNRTFYEDRDIKPTDSINFFLTLKTLGEVKTGFSKQGGN